ncbi:unnamed protein product [Cylindrotheca closterium]|uniref:SAP domain-containing protein n=1 Tax=Cylindrotheca closterium TaxID=2856 RepID=A0AAD2CGH0_9STRA|nr:unnamed protein product [Cylindrotheca closterium]
MKEQPKCVEIEFQVNAMKVVELRKELKRRDLETNGLKKQLQARLRGAMATENTTQRAGSVPHHPDCTSSKQPIGAEKSEASVIQQGNVKGSKESKQLSDGNDNFIEMREVNDQQKTESLKPSVNSSQSSHEAKVSYDEVQAMVDNEGVEEEKWSDLSTNATSPKKTLEEEVASNIKQYWKKLSKPANASTVTSPIIVAMMTHSESKKKKSPIRMVVKTVQKVLPAANDDPAQDIVISASNSDLTDDDFDGPISEFSKASAPLVPVQISKAGSVRDLVSKIQKSTSSASNTTGGDEGSGSALSKNLQAKKEARLARMAEIRGKSKPVMTSKHVLAPKEYASTLSSLNAVSAPVGLKKNNLAAQMREKAATAAIRKENMLSGVNEAFTSTAESAKRDLQSSADSSDNQENLVVSMSMQGFLKKQKVASPMSTYEISDREESDSDTSDSEAENEKQKKKIPVWAQKANLLPALEEQYNGCIGDRRVDPDEIFPEVQTCDLEAIFGGKKSRYTRRTSSGNWTQDKVTTAEKLVYKRTMGFTLQV